MARPLRIQYANAWYHVMNRGGERRSVFRDSKDWEIFLNLLNETAQMWKIEIHAYCFMPNHYHLLLRTPAANLSRVMRHINGVYTQRYNRRWKRDSQLFRGRYKAILVEDENYLVELARYIHCNPSKAKLVQAPENYNGSSYPYYLGRKDKPVCLTTETILKYFGKGFNKARKELATFTRAGVPARLEEKLSGKRWPAVLGRDDFEDWVNSNFVPAMKDREIIHPVRKKNLTLKQIVGAVTAISSLSWRQIRQAKRGEGALWRKLAILMLRCELGMDYKKIARCLGKIHPSQISRLLYKEQKLLKQSREWKFLLAETKSAIVKT